MKKEINCKECDSFLSEETICDTCGENIGQHENIHQDTFILLRRNNTDYDFCNFKCLLKFIVGELKKEKKNEDSELD